MEKKDLDRINELARLSRERALTPEEKEEQQRLRADYLAAFRRNLMARLDDAEVVDEQGNRTPLRRKTTLADVAAALEPSPAAGDTASPEEGSSVSPS